jgi:hypothetical protein
LRAALAPQTGRTHGLVLHSAARVTAGQVFVATDLHARSTVLFSAHQAVSAQCVLGGQRSVAESTALRLEIHRVLRDYKSDTRQYMRHTSGSVNDVPVRT